MAIPTRALKNAPKANTVIPVLGLGVYSSNSTTKSVTEALNLGYRLFDTANEYQNETDTAKGISEWLKSNPNVKREDVWYCTKIDDARGGYEGTKSRVEEALTKAKVGGLDYIDMLIIHAPYTAPPHTETRMKVWKALSEFVDEGKIRTLAVSNYGVKHLKEFWEADTKYKPVLNQIESSPWNVHQDIHDYCNEHNIVVEQYSPLIRGKKFDDDGVKSLAKKYNKTPAQILIRWGLDKGMLPIPKSDQPERQKSNADVFDFKLTSEEVNALQDLDSYLYLEWDPTVAP